MRILFGPLHDGLHVDPAAPGAYEWWYFDALSDDGRYALVVIFFLGSPMSPYYKAVVDGRNPDPRDWCGVFVTLHEKVKGRWKERAYAYNLYRGGDFAPDGSKVTIGGSTLRRTALPHAWNLTLREPGLWFGSVAADLTFSTVGASLDHAPTGEDDGHTWACIAPLCRVEGTVNGIPFAGDGYHDHNFGRLPWADVDVWYWGRAALGSAGGARAGAVGIFYHVVPRKGAAQSTVLVAGGSDVALLSSGDLSVRVSEIEFAGDYGLRFPDELAFVEPATGRELRARIMEAEEYADDTTILAGPFYRRHVCEMCLGPTDGSPGEESQGIGVCEIFRPARLCGPIASRAMWTRIRRRKTPEV